MCTVPFAAVHARILAQGHSLETFPTQMAAVRDAGHEM